LRYRFDLKRPETAKLSSVPERAAEPEGLRYGEPTWGVAHLFPLQGTWTESEYFALETQRRAEFSHGFIEFLPVATLLHHRILGYLYVALREFVAAEYLGEVLLTGVRVRLWPGKFREPDVLFMHVDHADRMTEEYWEGADLVMEVVSSGNEDRRRDLKTKREEYALAGIPEYWIVDPELGHITVLTLEGEAYVLHGEFKRGERATSKLLSGFAVDISSALTPKS
jgi:Uma2 family endonuclease